MLLVLPATRARKSASFLAPQGEVPGTGGGGAKAKYKSTQPSYQTAVIPPKGTRRQSRRRERAKPDVGIRYSFLPELVCGSSQGDADCHVARPSLLAMTGYFSLKRRFRHCTQYKSALPATNHHRHSEEGEARRGNPFSLTPNLVFSLSQGDADCHVARPSLLSMTGQLSLPRRFRHCRKTLHAKFRITTQNAHNPRPDFMQAYKKFGYT